MGNLQSFNFNPKGNYPDTEAYVTQTDSQMVDPDLGPYIYRNYLRYQKRPTNDIANAYLNTSIYNQFFTLGSYTSTCSVISPLDPAGNFSSAYPAIYSTDASNQNPIEITYNTSDIRKKFQIPSEFNFFYITPDPTSDASVGYVLYPNKLITIPTSLVKIANGWKLTTNTKVMLSSVQYFESKTIEYDATVYHLYNRLSSLPTVVPLSDFISVTNYDNYSLTYGISGSTTRVDRNVVDFTTKNPSYVSLNLEPSLSANYSNYLNIDSLFVTYSACVSNPTYNISNALVVSNLPDVKKYYNNVPLFNSSYIINYPNATATKFNSPIFQLIQTTIDPTSALHSFKNCVMYVTLSTNCNFTYFNNYIGAPYYTKGLVGSFIGVSYIADSPYIRNTKELIFNTVTPADTWNLNVPYKLTDIINQFKIYETKYPPHYYSYKTTLRDSTSAIIDSNSLNFYLYSKIVDPTTNQLNSNYVKLSSYITSDYNCLSYDLYSNCPNDYIRFKTNISPEYLPYINFSYGENLSTSLSSLTGKSYDIVKSPWIPVSSGKDLLINYPNLDLGELNFTIRASLSSIVAGQLDAFNATNITLGQYLKPVNNWSIELDIFNETSNSITIDASPNNSFDGWPYVDLTYSNIIWYAKDSQGNDRNDLSFNGVDQSGNVLQSIEPNSQYAFNANTWLLNVSGFSPDVITVYLSADLEIKPSSVVTDPNLFNYFSTGQLAVAPSSPLYNLQSPREIELSTYIPFNGKLYNLNPEYGSVPMYWTWSYDAQTDPSNQPISAYKIDSNGNAISSYNFGTHSTFQEISTIKILVTPYSNNTYPELHKIYVNAYTDIIYPCLSGSYNFSVDDLPDSNIINADFISTYDIDSDNNILSNTNTGQNTITRSELNYSTFQFTPLTKNQNYYANIAWYINGQLVNNMDKSQGIPYINIENDGSPNLYFNFYTSCLPTNDSNLLSALVTMQLTSVVAPGWTSAHDFKASTYVYFLSSVIFENPTEFLTYPQVGFSNAFAYLLTSVDATDSKTYLNYTLTNYPSSYNNTVNDTISLWLSSNRNDFNYYEYQNFSTYEITTVNSSYAVSDIPYNPNDIQLMNNGFKLSLVAYNDTTFPETMGTSYYAFSADGTSSIVKLSLNNTFTTYDSICAVNENPFQCSPLILPYDDVEFTFSVLNTSINLDDTKNVVIQQNFNVLSPTSPTKIMDGSVYYCLSSVYWTVCQDLSSGVAYNNNNPVTIFKIKIGDPYVPLYSGSLGIQDFFVYATPKVFQGIPSTVFAKISSQLPSVINNWSQISL